MNGRIIAQDHKDLPLRWPASFQKVKQTTIATFCNMKKQSVYQNVVDGVTVTESPSKEWAQCLVRLLPTNAEKCGLTRIW